MNLNLFIKDQIEFSKATFGEGERSGVLDHMLKEIEELREAPDDINEWIDLILLAIDGAWRSGSDQNEIVECLKAKLTINCARNWPDHTFYMASEAIQHLKPVDEGVYQIGNILRYSNGPTALMRIDSISLNHGGKGNHRYYGIHVLDGKKGVYHRDAKPASDSDLAEWRKSMIECKYRPECRENRNVVNTSKEQAS